jgi:hypothetical protein
VSPATATGVLLLLVVPSPSWPTLFRPQHRTVPSASSAQVWSSAAAIWACLSGRPVTVTGTLLLLVVPLPSCPQLFSPQHQAPPLWTSAHVWVPPVATDWTWDSPLTLTGVVLSVMVLLPSSPQLLSPQHRSPVASPPRRTRAQPP